MIYRTITLSLIALLGGCSATGPAYRDAAYRDAQSASLVIYRPSSVVYISKDFPVAVNGVDVCRLSNAGYTRVPVTSSQTTITGSLWNSPGTSRLTIDTSKHKTYYVKVEGGANIMGGAIGGFIGQLGAEAVNGSGPFDISLVPKEQALIELADIKGQCQL